MVVIVNEFEFIKSAFPGNPLQISKTPAFTENSSKLQFNIPRMERLLRILKEADSYQVAFKVMISTPINRFLI
jgi:hypothetical protein